MASWSHHVRDQTCIQTNRDWQFFYLDDGGGHNPNPTKFALQEAQNKWPERPIDVLLNLGTGEKTNGGHFDAAGNQSSGIADCDMMH